MSVLEQQQDPVNLWLQGLGRPKTRDTHTQALKRLSDVSGVSPFRMLEDPRRGMKGFWVHIKADASELKPHVQSSTISALGSYLRANGEFPPYDSTLGKAAVNISAMLAPEVKGEANPAKI